jgi:hypothetical protein
VPWPAPRPGRGLAIAALALCAAGPAAAVVISGGDGTGNTAPPADDPGFANVGRTSNNLSGVYLGGGYVLTADHVGVRDISFLGVSYPAIPGTGVQLANPDSSPADLLVYRIDGGPPLPRPFLASESAKIGDELLLVGFGWTREPNPTEWDASWLEQPPVVYTGYKRGGAKTLRWGRNVVSSTGQDFTLSGRKVRSLETSFDPGGAPDECQAVTGDSGGAAFLKRDGRWELVGLMWASGTTGEPGQPLDTAVYGNETRIADLPFYRDQILATTHPNGIPALPPAAGVVLALAIAAIGRGARRSGPGRARARCR